jgi:hypothetical protein
MTMRGIDHGQMGRRFEPRIDNLPLLADKAARSRSVPGPDAQDALPEACIAT